MQLNLPDHPLQFLISQAQRTIAVTIIPGDQLNLLVKDRARKKRHGYQHVYHEPAGWVSYSGAKPRYGLRFQSEEDLRLAERFLWMLHYGNELYGYVRLTKAETDRFLAQQSFSVTAYPGSPGIPDGQMVTFASGHVLLCNPHVENHMHGSLFTDYHSFTLEEKAMAEFMKYIDENP